MNVKHGEDSDSDFEVVDRTDTSIKYTIAYMKQEVDQ